MKVLLAGHCNTVFIVPLVRAMRANQSDVQVYAMGLNRQGQPPKEEEVQLFSETYPMPQANGIEGVSKWKLLYAYLKDKGWGQFWRLLKNRSAFKTAVVQHERQRQLAVQYRAAFADKDVLMVQYLTPAHVEMIQYLPPTTKLILCFWGSDLMQASDPAQWNPLYHALRKADRIIVQHAGIRFLCCVKYGWDLKSKIREAIFTPNLDLLHRIQTTTKVEAKQQIGSEWQIPTDKIWFSCGYRPIAMVQQAEIIKTLGALSASWRAKIVLILTMNYSTVQTDYIQRILSAVKEAGIAHVVIDRYLSVEEMAQVRKAMDVFIHLPWSDALSNTLVEHLYAGNFVVTDRSLPYNLLRRYEVDYKGIDNWSELLETVERGLEAHDFEKEANVLKIQTMIERHYSVQNWLDVIYE